MKPGSEFSSHTHHMRELVAGRRRLGGPSGRNTSGTVPLAGMLLDGANGEVHLWRSEPKSKTRPRS